jgi:hypothetical protein
MGANRKIFDEASKGGRDRLASGAHHKLHQKGRRMVARGLSLQERREVVAQVLPEYREASTEQKRLLLEAFLQRTGYHRKYAVGLLNQSRKASRYLRVLICATMELTSRRPWCSPGTRLIASVPNG